MAAAWHTTTTTLLPYFVMTTLCVMSLTATAVTTTAAAKEAPRRATTPNVVLIMADDLGYGDLGCYGNTTIRTPHIDGLASEGVRLTHSMAAATMCTPSRAAFMTGRYSIRSGMLPHHFMRVFPFIASSAGLPSTEPTLGKVAKKAGYKTAYLGKWHLGMGFDRKSTDTGHPLNHGFDYFYGTPLTNIHDFNDKDGPILLGIFPRAHLQLTTIFLIGLLSAIFVVKRGYAPLWVGVGIMVLVCLFEAYFLFLIYNVKLVDSIFFRNYDVVEQPIHLSSHVRKIVKESHDFLQARSEDQAPFLLVVSWLHMHTALDTAPEFKGRSALGPWGDALEEMDWGVGEVLGMLDRLDMEENTVVYFTSDHGADSKARDWLGRVTGGYNGPFKGYKGGGSSEGSFRVPTLFKWPGVFPEGEVIDEPVSLMDVLPTIAEALQVKVSDDDVTIGGGRALDGRSLVPLLTGKEKLSPHEFLVHYCQLTVHAVTYRPRSGTNKWKLSFYEPNEKARTYLDECIDAIHLDPPKLYELTSDPTAHNALRPADHPQVVSAILAGLKEHRDSVQEVTSQFAYPRILWNPFKQPCCNFPKCECKDPKFKGMFED